MANLQKLIDLDGLSYFLGQIKAKFVRSVNGVKPDSKGNVNIANMEGATSNVAGKAGLVPIPAAGKQDMALCGDATYKVLPIAGGGTGANTISAACKALGLEWDWFHRYGLNYVPPDVTNNGWNSLGLCLIYYTEVKIKNQPSTYGQLLNIPADQHAESTQIWIAQDSGELYFRGGNGLDIVNDEVFTKVATVNTSLGLPNYASYIQVSIGDFTPSTNGWLRLNLTRSSDYRSFTVTHKSSGNIILHYGQSRYPGDGLFMCPVIAKETYTISSSETQIYFHRVRE